MSKTESSDSLFESSLITEKSEGSLLLSDDLESKLRSEGRILSADPVECPYLEGKKFIQEYFFAESFTVAEWSELLSAGWRHFGIFFFRPSCLGCRECRPLRVLTEKFQPSKSQRRIIKKNNQTEFQMVSINDFFYNDNTQNIDLDPVELLQTSYDIYKNHSLVKFNQETGLDSFLESFYSPAVESYQSLYKVNGKIVATGYLDLSETGLSSVYFSYDPDYSSLGLGTYSVIKEAQWAKERGLSYYYLGYFIPECSRMTYKGKFCPCEIFDWEDRQWRENPHIEKVIN